MSLVWGNGTQSGDSRRRHSWDCSDGGACWVSRSSRVGTAGATGRGRMVFFPEGGRESRCVTTTSPAGFRGKLPVVGLLSS